MSPRPRFPRRKPRGRFDRAVLAPLIRPSAPVAWVSLGLTERRATLLRAIQAGEVKAGRGSYERCWRWKGSTVTAAVDELIAAGWARGSKTVELTEAGQSVLDGAP